jgi:DNA (cytosine-5)-methyltransferase 1
VDLILASPECTNHSVAKGAKERDEESRLTAFEVVRFASEFRPQWIVMENVVQMQSWSEHDRLVDELGHLGYSVEPTSLNAQDFGVPQSRNRLFLLCSLSEGVKLCPPRADHFKPASSIIDTSGIYKFSMLRAPSRAKPTIARAERAIDAIGSDTPFLIVYYGSDGSGGWQPISKPLRTITTLDRFAYVEPADGGHVMRMLQPNELKLAMGFDPDFKLDLPGFSRRQKIRLMGNGVCPPVMEFIIRGMTEARHQYSEEV